MTTKPSWVDGRVDTLLAELHDLGMSVSRAAATALINERVQWVRWTTLDPTNLIDPTRSHHPPAPNPPAVP